MFQPVTNDDNEEDDDKPTDLLYDEEEAARQETADKYRFLFSGLTAQEKIEYGAIIEQLGGTLYDVQYFNMQSTHIVINTLSRSVLNIA